MALQLENVSLICVLFPLQGSWTAKVCHLAVVVGPHCVVTLLILDLCWSLEVGGGRTGAALEGDDGDSMPGWMDGVKCL